MNKKGQAGTINGVILLVVGISVAVLVLIFVGALAGRLYNIVEPDIEAITQSVTNESVTVLNSTAVSFANDNINNGTLYLSNTSAGSVSLTEFTIDYDAGTITLIDNGYNNTKVFANYTHGDEEVERSIKNGVISGFEAIEQTGNYLPIIVLAFIIVFALGIVLAYGYIRPGAGGGSSAL